MQLTLIGMGGGAETLTAEALAALRAADAVLGAQRLLDALPAGVTARRRAAYRPDDIVGQLEQWGCERAAVVYSGDTGFYSGAQGLLARVEGLGWAVRVCPGISSVQLLAAALGRPWQGWRLVSAHGRECDAVAECLYGQPTFFLTGGGETPASLCAALTAAGLGDVDVTVGESLGSEKQKITRSTAREAAQTDFDPLSVLLVEAVTPAVRRAPGWPDEAFIRGDVPMTKQEVRAAVLAKLAIAENDCVWDVGAGTGSVSVEAAAIAKRVFAVECEAEACRLIEQNRAKFGAYNLTVIEGRAPEALTDLPAPDAVFLGGTKGELAAIADAALAKNPNVRLCAAAIALETLSAAVAAFTAHGLTAEVTQIAVSRTRAAGRLHLLMANNPVFLITGGGAQ